ncbi:ParA family protein [Pandoraea anhela]|uniref:Chromosome partitioning protein ParA n=1 Tax=Pandoraea anhela TaxID=2508295 RepID=A0A5E4XQ29_9BURK|nr:ParA family protein [Pandoraea anhela]VVE38182.1 chromosome partitioning protein ParA [Pandoraea anhela]
MTKIITLFNHKGGVSKTTTTFNLGWMLASLGKRVLLADFDPQCNLTGMVLGFKGIEDLEETYKSDPPNNVKDGLAPAFESKPRQIVGAECVQVPSNDNLFLLPGHIGLAEYETTLGVAQELSGSLLALRNLPGSLRFLLDATAEKYAIDYVLVDLSPSLGPMNQNLLMTCDHFIVPLHPDYFSSMALSSLSKSLPRWAAWAKTAYSIAVLRDADYPFPEPKAKFIGAVVQKYRPRNGQPSAAFQRWVDQLARGLRNELIPSLESCGLLNSDEFEEKAGFAPYEPLLNVADFNSLIAQSQEHLVPVYALTAEMLQQAGAVWDSTKESMQKFETAFRDCANKVISLTT